MILKEKQFLGQARKYMNFSPAGFVRAVRLGRGTEGEHPDPATNELDKGNGKTHMTPANTP